MVLNATFNNIPAISLWSVFLVEETGGPGENHRTVAGHWQTLWHNVVSLIIWMYNDFVYIYYNQWILQVIGLFWYMITTFILDAM